MHSRQRVAAVCLTAVAALFVPKPTFSPAVLWTTESAYNWIAVLQRDDLRWLVLNHPAYSQTTRKVGQVFSGFYTDDFALGPSLVPARRMLALGLGAGGAVTTTLAVAPNLHVDAVEIDPKVVDVAANYFGLPLNSPQLSVHVADARPWLAASPQFFDLVQVDLYQGGPYVPFYLITREFFEQVRARMNPEGLLMMNVYDTSDSRELLMAASATLKRVFSSVCIIVRPDGNRIVLAFPVKKSFAEIRDRLLRVTGDAQLQLLAQEAAANLSDIRPPADAPVFTDDHAPVEEMTRRMLHPAR